MSLRQLRVGFHRGRGTRVGALARGAQALCLIVMGTSAGACATGEASVPLTHTFASPDHLAGEVVEALNRRDAKRLMSLALTEHEFKAHVWPHLPVSHPERHVPFGFVWTRLHERSSAHLSSILTAYGGRELQAVSVRFRGETTDYGPFDVRRKAEVTVRAADGRVQTVRLFGSVLAQGGQYKLFSYVVD